MPYADLIDEITDTSQPRVRRPFYLIPEHVAYTDGIGPVVDVGTHQGKLLVLTLGIDLVIERESLSVSVWGSRDGVDWGPKPLVVFPHEHYCGLYSILLNLAKYPAVIALDLEDCPRVRYLQARWKMNRWGNGDPMPMFGFCLFGEESGSRVSSAAA